MDILDSIHDLEGDEYDLDDFTVEGVLVDPTDDFDAVLEAASEMSELEAREVTDSIRAAATATWALLSRAHEGKAYKALGYETWSDYVTTEFDMSTQRSYQLLDLAKAVKMIEEAVPEGTEVKLTEAQVRDLKKELPNVTESIRTATDGMDPDDAGDEVGRIVDEEREKKKAALADQMAEEKARKAKEEALEQEREDGYRAGLEAAADALLEADMAPSAGDRADDEFVEVQVAGERELSPEDTMGIYNFVNAATGLKSLPEPEAFVDTVPDSRIEDIYAQAVESAEWMNRLVALLESRI